MTAATVPTTDLTQWPDLCWNAAELHARSSWRPHLPDDVRREFAAFAAMRPDLGAGEFVWCPDVLPRLAAFGRRLGAQLLRGDGLCWLRGLDTVVDDEEPLRCLFLALGCAIGEPLLQYGRLYPVVDRGASYTAQSVPVSMTNAETCFHTDSSSVDVVPDVVALLCEQPSLSGGDSLVSNALRAHRRLQREAPELLAQLELPMVRDVVTPGVDKTHANLLRNRFPVFAPSDRPGGMLFRYMRYWLELGQQKAGEPLAAIACRALDALDALLADPEHVVRFRLARGDAIFVNNRVLAHNRTAYQDTPGNTRRLQRMWLRLPAAC